MAHYVENKEQDGIELYFDGQFPDEELCNQMKAAGLRYTNYKKCWYTKTWNTEGVAFIKRYCGEDVEVPTAAPAPAKYGCLGVGIDLLDSSLVIFDKKIQYICGNFEHLKNYGLSPTLTLSIDSLYFCSNIDIIAEQLGITVGNRLYLFWSQYLFDEAADRACLNSNRTALACALQKARISYKTVDYSKNEHCLYIALAKALRSRRHLFESEGNIDLFEQKLDETLYGIELYEKKLASRYLYIASR